MLLRPTLRPLFHPQTNPFSTLTRLRPPQPSALSKILPHPPPPSSSFLRRSKPLLLLFGLTVPFLTHSSPHTSFDTSPTANPNHPTTSNSTTTTPTTSSSRILTPALVRQISFGSILGLGVGLLISTFSRSLTVILGLGVVVWGWAAQKGFNFIPVERVGRYVRGDTLRRIISGENAPLKIAFGVFCALSTFGEF